MRIRTSSAPVAVYRAYDATGELIYVGVARNWAARWEQHAASTPTLYRLTGRLHVDWCGSRAEAIAIERHLAMSCQPLFNVTWCDPRRRLRPRELRCDRCACWYAEPVKGGLDVGKTLGSACGDESAPPYPPCPGRLRYAYEIMAPETREAGCPVSAR